MIAIWIAVLKKNLINLYTINYNYLDTTLADKSIIKLLIFLLNNINKLLKLKYI